MAIFFPGPCPLCGVEMTRNDRLFATTAFLRPYSDLWRFSDAVMHWDCYSQWEHRARFGRMYFEAKRAGFVGNSFWGVAYSDDRLLVATNPEKLVNVVEVWLAETGSGFRVSLPEWEDWLNGEGLESCHHAIEREALSAMLPLLRSKLPTASSIIAAAGMKADNRSSAASVRGCVERVLYENVFRRLARRAARKGVTCPGCGTFSTEYKYMEVKMVSENGPLSHLVCPVCGKRFGPMHV